MRRTTVSLIFAGLLALPLHAQDLTNAGCAAGLTTLDGLRGPNAPALKSPQGAAPQDGWCHAPRVHFDWLDGKWPQSIGLSDLRWKGIGSDVQGPQAFEIALRDLRLHLRNGPGMTDLSLGGFLGRSGADVAVQATYDPVAESLDVGLLQADLPGDSRVTLNADLSSVSNARPSGLAAMQVHQIAADLRMSGSFGRTVVIPLIGTDKDRLDKTLADARVVIASLPVQVLDADSQQALTLLIADLPNPRGRLSLSLAAPNGFGAAQLTRIALRGLPKAPADWGAALNGVQISVSYDPMMIGN